MESPGGEKGFYWLSVATLFAVFGAYLAQWLVGNWPMLTDPRLQTDDARTTIFPFHRYGPEGALADDPIASEMLALVPIGVRFLYRILVPFTDVFVAPKIVQGLALVVLLVAGVVMARSRRAGLGAAVLLIFAVLHDWYAINRVAGGLPRAFGFPCFALWLSGVVSQRRWARFSAPVLAALTYPSVMNMILAAEGLYALRGVGRISWSVVGRRLLRYAAVVALCFVAVLPALVGGDDRGPIHTLEQAKKEPAFGKRGRLWILPFANPAHAFGEALVDQMQPRGASPSKSLRELYEKDAAVMAVAVLAALLLLPFLRWSPPPWALVAFFTGTTFLYMLSRVMAFRLYSPERYYSFGMRMVTIALIVTCVAQIFFWLRPRLRHSLRNFAIALVVFGIWGMTGNGVVKNNGMTIDARRDAELYEYIGKLPKDVRIASHIFDGDGVPYYSARATMGGFETLQPWFVESWRRQKDRAEATIRALYATDVDQVLDYAQKNGVTHFLINKNRYNRDFRKTAGSFEPFTDYARDYLRGKKLKELVFRDPLKEAVVFRQGRWRVVSVEKLAAAAKKPH